jgi:DNA-binding transcriptional LysR family regulator
MVDLDHWRAFVKVVESGSFARAAEQMQIARSAVSRRVSELEQHLGAHLLHRSTRQLSVTEAGTTFYERAAPLLIEIEELESATVRGGADIKGPIRLAAPLSFTYRHLQPTLNEFRKQHPQVTFELNLGDRRVDILSEGYDFALRIGAEMEGSMVARRLCTIHHMVCASPEYLRTHGVPQTPDALIEHSVLCYPYRTKSRAWRYWTADGAPAGEARLNPAMYCDNGDILLQAALDGAGIVCEPTFICHEAIAHGTLVPLLAQWRWSNMNAYLVFPPHRRMPARVRLLMDTLAARISDPPSWDLPLQRWLPALPG